MKAIDLGSIITHYINHKGDTVSHKKLQKLLYYIEAWHLVNFNQPLLDEDFEAWVHGPVIPNLFHHLKAQDFNSLDATHEGAFALNENFEEIIAKNNLSANQLELIKHVLHRYGSLTSFELEMLIHNEAPWVEARKNVPPHQSCKTIISKDRMKEFYTNLA